MGFDQISLYREMVEFKAAEAKVRQLEKAERLAVVNNLVIVIIGAFISDNIQFQESIQALQKQAHTFIICQNRV